MGSRRDPNRFKERLPRARTALRVGVLAAGVLVWVVAQTGLAALWGQPCVSQSNPEIEPANSVNCGVLGVHDDTSYWRSFDLAGSGMTGPTCLQRVEVGVEEATSPCGRQPLIVRVYADVDANPAPVSNLTLLDERTVSVEDQLLSTVTVDFATPIPAGAFLVVEVHSPRGPLDTNTRFLIGTNGGPETAPSYLSATGCQIPEPVPIPSLLPPSAAVRVVMEACLTSGACPCTAPTGLTCALVSNATGIHVTWTNIGFYDVIQIFVDEVGFFTLPGNATSVTVPASAYVGTEVAIEVRGLIAGAPCPGSRSCTLLVMPPPTSSVHEYYSFVGAPVAHNMSAADNVYVPAAFTVGTVQVEVDITHPVQSDLVVRVSSPNGSEVTLHENNFFQGGFYQPDLHVIFSDAGVDNCWVPSNCGCPVTPFGPGRLSDLACQNATGTWLLTVEDTFNGNDGVLNSWRLGLEPSTTCCARPTNLQAISSCSGDAVSLSWTNHAVYDAIEIFSSGVPVASLSGQTTSFTHVHPGSGFIDYEIAVSCGGNVAHTLGIQVEHAAYNGETDVILALEGLQSGGAMGLTDSATALANSLAALGRGVVVVRALPSAFPCAANAQVLWVLTGTFPNDYRLSISEGNWLAGLSQQGVAIYLESADHWGFNHLPSAFDARDGIDHTLVADGDDSLTRMNGSAAPRVDLTGFQYVSYEPDNPAGDGTDRLVLSAADAGVTAHALWRNAPDGFPTAALPEDDYVVGVLHENDVGGDVIVASWEFGGFTGNRNELASLYLGALVTSRSFIRGDCNQDGAVDLGDVIALLTTLFPSTAGYSPSCDEACDGNDDGNLNVADPISMLIWLFGAPSIPLPYPQTCGPDITPSFLECSASICP
ncbi:MAG: proprotein convertase P-domain-containing protein [Planctomycetota bacterium]